MVWKHLWDCGKFGFMFAHLDILLSIISEKLFFLILNSKVILTASDYQSTTLFAVDEIVLMLF